MKRFLSSSVGKYPVDMRISKGCVKYVPSGLKDYVLSIF